MPSDQQPAVQALEDQIEAAARLDDEDARTETDPEDKAFHRARAAGLRMAASMIKEIQVCPLCRGRRKMRVIAGTVSPAHEVDCPTCGGPNSVLLMSPEVSRTPSKREAALVEALKDVRARLLELRPYVHSPNFVENFAVGLLKTVDAALLTPDQAQRKGPQS